MLNSDYRCRKATLQDPIEKIAKYIYLTDPYIYPKISPSPKDTAWIELIGACLTKEDNIFSIRHITVVTCGDEIVGIACVVPCGKKLTFSEDIPIPEALSGSILPVIEGYFAPLIAESLSYRGYNIVNICIDENHRGKGVGKQLMTHCIREYADNTLHLDAIAANLAAVRLYQAVGFRISGQYMGFSGDSTPLSCYHMVRPASVGGE